MDEIDHDKGYYQGTLHAPRASQNYTGAVFSQHEGSNGWYSSQYGGSEMDEIDHDKGHYQGTLHAPRPSQNYTGAVFSQQKGGNKFVDYWAMEDYSSKNSAEFYNRAAKPGLVASSGGDTEP